MVVVKESNIIVWHYTTVYVTKVLMKSNYLDWKKLMIIFGVLLDLDIIQIKWVEDWNPIFFVRQKIAESCYIVSKLT